MATRRKDIDEAIGLMTASALVCRDEGHDWQRRTAVALRGGGWERVRVCRLCATERVQLLDRRADIVSNRYRYPEGYRVVGLGHLTSADRAALRLVNLKGSA